MTLKDIASEAGVSMMTVSNVINGKHNKVSEKTICKVNAVIEKYNFSLNMSARNLTTKASNIATIIISLNEQEAADNYLENPYISTMIGTIEKLLREHNYYTMVRAIQDFSEVIALLNNWNSAGLIFLYPSYTEEIKESMPQINCPIAIFDSNIIHDNVINIASDDHKGTYLSTKYLINQGHTDIAFIADYKNNALLTRRFEGYLAALKENHISYRSEYVFEFSPSYSGGIKAGKQIANAPFPITGVVTTADICAIGVIEGARLSGHHVPVNLSVIGFDNLTLCSYTTPKLTSVSQHIVEKCTLATTALINRMNGDTAPFVNQVMDVEIVERQSVISIH